MQIAPCSFCHHRTQRQFSHWNTCLLCLGQMMQSLREASTLGLQHFASDTAHCIYSTLTLKEKDWEVKFSFSFCITLPVYGKLNPCQNYFSIVYYHTTLISEGKQDKISLVVRWEKYYIHIKWCSNMDLWVAILLHFPALLHCQVFILWAYFLHLSYKTLDQLF